MLPVPTIQHVYRRITMSIELTNQFETEQVLPTLSLLSVQKLLFYNIPSYPHVVLAFLLENSQFLRTRDNFSLLQSFPRN